MVKLSFIHRAHTNHKFPLIYTSINFYFLNLQYKCVLLTNATTRHPLIFAIWPTRKLINSSCCPSHHLQKTQVGSGSVEIVIIIGREGGRELRINKGWVVDSGR